VIVFVAAYLFREWVIQNTAVAAAAEAAAEAEVEPEASEQQNNNNSEHLAQQQATVDDIIHAVRSVNTTDQAVLNEREQISKRLEELRREIEQRRRITVVDDTNNYVNNSNVITKSDNQNNDNDDNDDNDEEEEEEEEEEEDNNIYLNPPSGTQSPFASWRDYQQDNANSSLNHRNQQYTETTAASRSSTWRAREFSASSAVERSDYFAEQFLDETVLDEEEEEEEAEAEAEADNPPAIAAPPVVDPIAPNNNNEAPFDFGEDFDGILEAIGMHGNILILVQNSILMSLMINLCLCVTVWIPYVIGRCVILVCMCFIHERILLLIIHI
jgi:E3 ubiquitin-protein ligase DOA10